MKKKYRNQYGEINYWESTADILIGLLLIVLLIVLLLILYLIRIPDKEYVDDHLGVSYAEYEDPDDGGGNYGYPQVIDDGRREDYPYRDPDSGGGGGGGGRDDEQEVPQTEPLETPEPGMGEGTGTDRTAVYVQVVDGETQSTIKRAGMEYELYTSGDALQTLSVYYPRRTDYTRYETTADGVFFLPEKLIPGSYYLHGLTAIRGYDVTEKTAFLVDEPRDWADPLVVTVELYPSRSTVRLQLKDQDTGKKLGGGVFNVIAQTDVATLDGTTRYHAGQIVDTVTLDESGYGESIPLYLGEYRIEQVASPQYYAMMEATPSVTVLKGSADGKPALTELAQQRTTVRVTLVDALYKGRGLAGAGFVLTNGEGTVLRRLTTQENGQLTLSELTANTTYRLRQLSAPESYQMDGGEYAFSVDSRGYIDGSAVAELTLTNEIVRVAIGVRGMLLGALVSDENMSLYTADGELIRIWNSTAVEQVFEGLAPGEYKVAVNGRLESAKRIVVRQTAEMQTFYCREWTTVDVGVVCIAAAAAALALAVIVYLIVRKRRKR